MMSPMLARAFARLSVGVIDSVPGDIWLADERRTGIAERGEQCYAQFGRRDRCSGSGLPPAVKRVGRFHECRVV